MRAKEDSNRHQLFSTNKQYVKITDTKRDKSLEYFVLVKTQYW